MNVEFRFSVGQRVRIPEAKIVGTVDRIAFGPEFGHEYRVVFWHDGQRRCEWLYEREVEDASTPARDFIGMRPEPAAEPDAPEGWLPLRTLPGGRLAIDVTVPGFDANGSPVL